MPQKGKTEALIDERVGRSRDDGLVEVTNSAVIFALGEKSEAAIIKGWGANRSSFSLTAWLKSSIAVS